VLKTKKDIFKWWEQCGSKPDKHDDYIEFYIHTLVHFLHQDIAEVKERDTKNKIHFIDVIIRKWKIPLKLNFMLQDNNVYKVVRIAGF